MKNKKRFVAIAAIAVLSIVFSACTTNQEPELPDPVTIEYWRLWDDSEVFEPLIAEYQQQKPWVTVNYKKLTIREYEKAVIDALASGKGPDIWSIHHTWLPKHVGKLQPAPQDLISIPQYQDTFVPVAEQDFTLNGQVFGVPLYVDTMALYYNKDLFNSAFIIDAPQTWRELRDITPKLTSVDDLDQVQQSAVAMGTAQNINRSPDILSLIMLQNGTQMTTEDKLAASITGPLVDPNGEEYLPGLDALNFYTDFANPRKTSYTWTPSKGNSIDEFVAEEVAMMFNYSYQQENIEAKAPKLNYGIAKMPQLAGTPKQVNYPNYWGEVVSKSSENPQEAWDFLVFLAGKEQMTQYTQATGNPASRKDVLAEQATQSPEMRVFAEQALTAQSWFQPDNAATDGIFTDMIESVVLGEKDSEEALNSANQQLTSVLQQYEGFDILEPQE